ncbi:MAG: T9SS type A sorting domain-containing protein, partial [Prevotella sp.]
INDVLNYTILFENDPEFATAAAQMVDVRFDFQNKAWMKGFGIGGYSFSNMSFPVAKLSNAYQNRIDLKDSLGYYVDLIGGLDVAKQQGFWTFTTIDPETGYAPWQAEMGLLPVNDSTHVGEGAVTFQLKPYEGLKTGDTISIKANIVFDQNDTIPTNRWTNTIDAGNPESKLMAELHPTLPNVYNLKFTAKDDDGGSGVRHVLLYLANHSGVYEEIDTCKVDSVLAFPVEAGKQYKLYSIAIDNTGNREPAKMEPDVILNFNTAPTDIALSDSIFQDDLAVGGFVGKLTSVDSDENTAFTYALAEGEGALHNDLFQIEEDQLQIKNTFKCAEDSVYEVRISTTDEGGLSFSKSFTLYLRHVLEKPEPDTLDVTICEGDIYDFHGMECEQAGVYRYSKDNDYMCDSVFVLNLTVLPLPEKPLVTFEGEKTLVSSADKGNQWYSIDGTPIEGATEQKFTPEEDGTYYVRVSNGSCISQPSQAYRVFLSNATNLQMNLAKGWNWISSNLSEEDNQDAITFLKPIENVAERLVGHTTELYNDPKLGFVGNLKVLNPSEGYKLFVSDPVQNTWSGIAYRADSTIIQLYKGWNWIGYVPINSMGINEALANLEPSENDVLKTLDAFATYSDGKWTGTLDKMDQAVGYMYYSGKNTTFKYPYKNVYSILPEPSMSAKIIAASPWQYNPNAYSDNKTIIAEVYDDSGKALEGVYSVGAFVGKECRGMGKYVDGLLYLTVHGTISDNEKITFKAYENATSNECDIKETLEMDGVQTGTVKAPFVFHTSNTTGISKVTSFLNIYPNPVRNTMYINGDTDLIEDLKILSSNGSVVYSANKYNPEGIDVTALLSGVYIVALKTNEGYQYKKIIVLKQ